MPLRLRISPAGRRSPTPPRQLGHKDVVIVARVYGRFVPHTARSAIGGRASLPRWTKKNGAIVVHWEVQRMRKHLSRRPRGLTRTIAGVGLEPHDPGIMRQVTPHERESRTKGRTRHDAPRHANETRGLSVPSSVPDRPWPAAASRPHLASCLRSPQAAASPRASSVIARVSLCRRASRRPTASRNAS